MSCGVNEVDAAVTRWSAPTALPRSTEATATGAGAGTGAGVVTGGGVLVVVGTVVAALAVPSFVRYRVTRPRT